MSTVFFTLRLCYNFVSILYIKRLVAGLSPRRPGFEPRPFHVGCVMGRIAVASFFSKTRPTLVFLRQWRSDDIHYRI